MAHTSRCAKATGPLAKCRCACGGSLHAGAGGGVRALTASPSRATLSVTDDPRVARLRAGAASGVAHTRLLGGESGSKTELRTYNDGTKAVVKGVNIWDQCDYPPDHQRDAEVLGPVFLECADLPTNAAYVDDDGNIVVEHQDDFTPAGYAKYGASSLMIVGGLGGPGMDDAWALALADLGMSNSDRNDGNYSIADGRINGCCDHATAFDWVDQNEHGPPTGRLAGYFNEWFANAPTDNEHPDDRPPGWRVDGDEDHDRIEVTLADVRRFKRRLKARRHRFTDPTLQRNRLDWWRKGMARYNALEAHLEQLPPRPKDRIR